MGLSLDSDSSDGLLALTTSDNAMVSKVALALTSLVQEVEDLCREAETRFYTALFYYGEGMEKVMHRSSDVLLFGGISNLCKKIPGAQRFPILT